MCQVFLCYSNHKKGFDELSGRHGKKKQHQKMKEKPAVVAAVVPATNPAKEEPKNTGQAVEKKRVVQPMKESATHYVPVAGLIVAVIVAIIYFCQLRSMQDSVDLARKNAEIDQRAWIQVIVPKNYPLDGATV